MRGGSSRRSKNTVSPGRSFSRGIASFVFYSIIEMPSYLRSSEKTLFSCDMLTITRQKLRIVLWRDRVFEFTDICRPKAADGRAVECKHGPSGLYLGTARDREVRHRGAVRLGRGPGVRLPAGQPAGAGGHHRRAPDRGGAQCVLPAPHDRPGEALLPVSGRIERLLPGGAEGLLPPDPGAADRGVPAAGGLHRRGQGTAPRTTPLQSPCPPPC